MSILIVEDNTPVRRMICDLVAPLAGQIYECGDGNSAVEMYRRFHPDWVLMDIDLPEMDGLTAARQIIAEDAAAHILIVTSYDGAEWRQMSHTAGASGFINKENLFQVRSFLKKQLPIV